MSDCSPVVPISKKKWVCDFCREAVFPTYEEALKHEKQCEERSHTITISYQQGRKLGLVLLPQENRQQVFISDNSALLIFTKSLIAAADHLFSWNDLIVVDHEALEDEILQQLVVFAQKNINPIELRNVSYSVSSVNDESLKAAVMGKIRPGDIIAKVSYQDGSKEVRKASFSCKKLGKVLNCPDRYPVELTLQHSAGSTRHHTLHNPLCAKEKLDLSENMILQHIEWSELLNRICNLHHLKELDLSNNNIGREACTAIASMLKNQSALNSLSLSNGHIDDTCISLLVDGLKHNKSLKSLNLFGNTGITQAGKNCILTLLCDKTTISSTYNSNHTLQAEMGFVQYEISHMLSFNRKQNAALRKIEYAHFQGDSFDLQPFLDMDVKIMPALLVWLANNSSESCSCRLGKIYYFIRNWDVPVLFGFPSAESIRIGSRMSELETLVKKLRLENAQLKEEVQALKEASSSPTETSLKKRRKYFS